MKLLLDMNISPGLCEVLSEAGLESVHWSKPGSPKASDAEILEFAKLNGYVLLSHDLDFGSILSATHAHAPSVIQVRFEDVLSPAFSVLVREALNQFEHELASGALVVIDGARSRARILPLG